MVKKLKDEITTREALVLNNLSYLHVVSNKFNSFMDVLVTFPSTKMPCIYLNNYNFGMIKFIWKTKIKPLDLLVDDGHSNKKTELENINEDVILNKFKLHYYDLK